MDVSRSPAARRPQAGAALAWARQNALGLGLALCFAVALALRLYRLGAQSLWLDEGGTWAEVTRRGWLALLADLGSRNAAYPLYHLLLKAWIALAGDSEWALRLPSAVAGAAAVVVIALAARLSRPPGLASSAGGPIGAALLLAMSPYALWYAQDAKAYSLLIFAVALLLWAFLRALRDGAGRAWALVAVLALAAVLVHRLALLPVAALVLALAIIWPAPAARLGRAARPLVALLGLALALAGVYGLAGAVVGNGWQESGHVAAGPLLGLWLTLAHFSLDRGDIGGSFGLPLFVWTLPAVGLTAWGLALLVRDARRQVPQAVAVLCAFALPLLLFALVLAFAPLYESRYVTVAFPAWIVVLARPLFGHRQATGHWLGRAGAAGRWLLVVALLLINGLILFQPRHGLFSGAPVKEEWRAAVEYLAAELHPDDLLIVHPYYTLPLWQYYAGRVTPDPLPAPVVFSNFGEGDCTERFRGQPSAIRECFRRRYDQPFNAAADGRKRALLLLAPSHAATIDRPKTIADLEAERLPGEQRPSAPDKYGWVGLRFQYDQRSWPCGGASFVGLEVMCQSYPEVFRAGRPSAAPQPATPLDALFGAEIRLRGYSLDLHGGAARPGGSLPITLFWEAARPPSRDYRMFLHLCADCSVPPLANDDDLPLNGYAPAGLTSTWQVGDPVHDERALGLPANLPPGRYTLLLGVYPADDPDPTAEDRLPVVSAGQTEGGTRLVLGQIDVGR